MKKKVFTVVMTAIILYNLFPGLREPDAGIYPPRIPVATACILMHQH